MGSNHSEHHIIPFNILIKVMAALFVFTVLTVFFAKGVNLGPFASLIAFIIAGTKAYLVMAYFMGLKYDTVHNRLIFATGFFFLFVLWVCSVTDIYTRITQHSTL